MDNNIKRSHIKTYILVGVCVLLAIIAIPYIIIIIAFNTGGDRYTVKTACGDRFEVMFDDFTAKSSVSPLDNPNPDTILSITVKFKPTESDFVVLKHSDDLTLYNLDGRLFYKDDNGWHYVDEDTKSDNPKAAEAAREAIRSNRNLEKDYKQYL